MKLSEAGAGRIANYEGYRALPYWDVDHYSIGYGTRARSASDGPISMTEAKRRLRHHADTHVGKAVRALKLPLNQNQFDALVSFGFNLGTGIFEQSTTVGALLHSGRLDKAADAFLLYDRAGGQVLAGLTRRRQEERALFLRKPPVAYTEDERVWLRVLKDKSASKTRRRKVAGLLRAQARAIQTRARAERDGWAKHDRGRRFQGIRRALKRHAP